MAVVSLEQFSKQLVDSGLLSAEDLTSFLSRLPSDKQPQDGEQLARELVRQKRLTKFQAEQIYIGKGKSLVLGNYLLLEKLGQGGMGMVLKAEHRRMKRLVALKVLSPDVTKSKELVARFHREVEAVARLEHPNIVAAYDADEAGGTHFFVMQYVEGRDLSSYVKMHGRLPIDKAIQYTLQAARGLEYAHKQGVIHRDIKPGNLLLSKDGVVRILDMGLARIEDAPGDAPAGRAELTNTGAVMGTVDYMSPEQALDTKHADARSDIYSLGCTLYYLLTGQPVYSESTMMKRLLAHRETPIPLVSAALKTPPQSTDSMSSPSATSSPELAAIDAVVARFLAKRPDDRYQSMTEVIATLSALIRGDVDQVLLAGGTTNSIGMGASSAPSMTMSPATVVATLASESETIGAGSAERTLPTITMTLADEVSPWRQRPKANKNLLAFGISVTLMLLLCVVFYFGGFLGRHKPSAEEPAKTVAVTALSKESADEAIDSGPWAPGRIDDRWHGVLPRPASRKGVTRWQVETIAPRGRAVDLQWSPDGKLFVVYSEDERLRVYRWDGKRIVLDHIIPTLDGGQTVRMKWSPDSQWIAWQADFTTELRTWDTLARKYGPVMQTGYRTGLAGWNKEGTILVAGAADTAGAGVFFWEWPSGQLKHAARGHSQPPRLVVWSPDGQFIAANDEETSVRIWQPDGMPVETVTVPNAQFIRSLAWNPRQHVLAVRCDSKKPAAELWINRIGKPSESIAITLNPIWAHADESIPVWTPDGTEILALNQSVYQLQSFGLDGTPGKLWPFSGYAFSAFRSGTDQILAAGSGRAAVLWDHATGEKVADLAPNGMAAGMWSPDGRWLGVADGAGNILVWDVEKRVVSDTVQGNQWMMSEPEWDAASKRLTCAQQITVHWPSPGAVVTWGADGQRQILAPLGSAGVVSIHRWNREKQLWVMSNGGLIALDPQTGERLPTPKALEPSGRQLAMAVGSPIDDRLLVATTGPNGFELALTRSGGTNPASIPVPQKYAVLDMTWSPDASRFAVWFFSHELGTGSVEIWEPSRPAKVASTAPGIGGKLKFSRNGKSLLAIRGTAQFIRSDTGALISDVSIPNGGSNTAGWAPDGKHFVIGVGRTSWSELEVYYSITSSVVEDSLPWHRNMGAAWSPDGKWIAGVNQDAMVRVWQKSKDAWSPAWTSVALPGDDWATFSAGGKLLWSSSNADRYLFATLERTDGTFETLPYSEFAASQASVPAPDSVGTPAVPDSAN